MINSKCYVCLQAKNDFQNKVYTGLRIMTGFLFGGPIGFAISWYGFSIYPNKRQDDKDN